MSSWRVARSLETFVHQCNVAWPHRNKASDGTIGDASHAARQSDHNPNSHGVVTAFDCTHDPHTGADMNVLADALTRTRDSRIKYVIWNRRIMDGPAGDNQPSWVWRAYDGASPHTEHLHLSVSADPAKYDDASDWQAFLPAHHKPSTPPRDLPSWWRDRNLYYVAGAGKTMGGSDVRAVRARLGMRAREGDYFTIPVRDRVMKFQREHGLTDDGIVGPDTARALGD